MKRILFHSVSNDSEVSKQYKVQLREIRGIKVQDTAFTEKIIQLVETNHILKEFRITVEITTEAALKNIKASPVPWVNSSDRVSSWNLACLTAEHLPAQLHCDPSFDPHTDAARFCWFTDISHVKQLKNF